MRKFSVKIAKRKLHELWSLYIRQRDKRCQWCQHDGKINSTFLQSHHIVSVAICGNAGRYDVENGIALCYHCHIDRLKQEVDEYIIFRDYWLKKRGLNYRDLRSKYHGAVVKINRKEYEIKKEVLEEMIEGQKRIYRKTTLRDNIYKL